MKIKIIILLLITAISNVFADSNQALIDSAAIYYKNSQFDFSAKCYEKVLASGNESSEIYFNLANSYYKSNKLTQAILNYERAHRLAPNDEDIKFNLELANKFIVDKIVVLPEFFLTKWMKATFGLFSSDTWAIYSICSFVLFLSLISLFLFSRIMWMKKSAFWLGIVVLIISVASFVFSIKQKENAISTDYAIITTPTVNIKSSPDTKGVDIFILHEGSKVMLIDNIGNWHEIKLSDGSVGWIESGKFEVI